MEPQDTIVAIATAPGRGGVGVVRVSGPRVAAIEQAVCGRPLRPRSAELVGFRDADGNAIDRGIAIRFLAPASVTGEDVLELQGHGGPVVLDMLLQRVLGLGARLARPGEFSQRAFLNDKLDLAQAEAVADLVEAGSRQAARAALRSLDGEFSRRVHALVERLVELRVHIEAALDFPDEDIDFLADGALRERLEALAAALATTVGAAAQGRLLRDGITVVIAGPPNVGKSSLLNRLAERDSAIVTDVAGTTRDVLRELIQIDGLPLHLIDTAGLRDSEDPIEQEGVRRAREQIHAADRVLLMSAPGVAATPAASLRELPSGVCVDEVVNKIDLEGGHPDIQPVAGGGQRIRLSVKTGAGLDLLRAHLKRCMAFEADAAAGFIARRRHLDALERAGLAVEAAGLRLSEAAGELAAEELRAAQRALGEITGEFTSDDLLGRIFAGFCIGK